MSDVRGRLAALDRDQPQSLEAGLAPMRARQRA